MNETFIGKRMCALAVAALMAIALPAFSTERAAHSVSLISLLANPNRFENEFVRVIGYLGSGPNLHLYLTKDHARVFDYRSSIEIKDTTLGGVLTQSSCAGNFVRVTGVFGKVYGGLPGIVDVEKVDNLDRQEMCWSRSAAAPGDTEVSP